MKTKLITHAIIILTMIFLFTAGTIFAQEKKIDLKDVPAKVLDSFHKAFPKAEIKGTLIEKENNHTYYEIESMEGSRHIDLLILKTGEISEVEETVTENEFPAPVMKTLKSKFAKFKVSKAEKVTSGKKITFEMSIESNEKMHSVVILPDGKIVKDNSIKEENEKTEKGEKEKDEDDD